MCLKNVALAFFYIFLITMWSINWFY